MKYGYQLVEESFASGREGNARSYKAALDALRKFSKGKDLSFSEVTFALLTRFEGDFIGRGNSLNGFAAYMRRYAPSTTRPSRSGSRSRKRTPSRPTRSKLPRRGSGPSA
jgi:hypothetical protein